jgi:hypothetical protein
MDIHYPEASASDDFGKGTLYLKMQTKAQNNAAPGLAVRTYTECYPVE